MIRSLCGRPGCGACSPLASGMASERLAADLDSSSPVANECGTTRMEAQNGPAGASVATERSEQPTSRLWKPDELYALQRLAHELSHAATEALSTMAAERTLGIRSTRLDAVVAAMSGIPPALLAAARRYATAYHDWLSSDQESAAANAAYVAWHSGLAPTELTDRLRVATARESAALVERDAALEKLKAAAREVSR